MLAFGSVHPKTSSSPGMYAVPDEPDGSVAEKYSVYSMTPSPSLSAAVHNVKTLPFQPSPYESIKFRVYPLVPLFAKHAVIPSATVIGAPPERTTVPAASTISHDTSPAKLPPSTVTTYSFASHGRTLT